MSSRLNSTTAVAQSTRTTIHDGLQVLVDKNPSEPEIVDIVAIHGLNGDFERTWTSRNKDGTHVNWLRDLLPRDLENARIMSFAYKSSVQFSKSFSDVFVFADQLLENLNLQRQSPEEQRRPIIFICHSLGGIVFKQVSSSSYLIHRNWNLSNV